MIINEVMKKKGTSRYRLAITSGISWTTLSNICYGKKSLTQCDAKMVQKLSNALEMTTEGVLNLTDEPYENQNNGKPQDSSYLKTNLSAHLQKSIGDYVQGEKNKVTYMDCLWGELCGSINAGLWAGVITEEQAVYLRTKYLYGTKAEGEHD